MRKEEIFICAIYTELLQT